MLGPTRLVYKLLALLLVTCILLIIFLNNFSNNEQKGRILLGFYSQNQAQNMKIPKVANHSYSSLLNLSNFEYLLESQMCLKYNKDLFGIILMTSAAAHSKKRRLNRMILSEKKLKSLGFMRVFLLGDLPKVTAADEDEHIHQSDLEYEQARYGDLLQGNFQDTYHNLSYKNIMGLRWAAINCTRAQFIIKLDDEIMHNIFQIKFYLSTLILDKSELAYSNSFLAGAIFDGATPEREPSKKWFVSKEYYPPATYPPYLSGSFYLTNPSTALRLVQQGERAKDDIFWIDDVWITGILQEPLNISLQFLNDWYCFDDDLLDCCIHLMIAFNYCCECYIGSSHVNSHRFMNYILNAERSFFKGCTKHKSDLAKACL